LPTHAATFVSTVNDCVHYIFVQLFGNVFYNCLLSDLRQTAALVFFILYFTMIIASCMKYIAEWSTT
jgi:hypothetical protein